MSELPAISWTPNRILSLLNEEDQKLFITVLSETIKKFTFADTGHLVRFLARMLGTRAEALLGWPPHRLARELFGLAHDPEVANHIERALIAFHFEHRNSMMVWLLDQWHIAHDEIGVVPQPIPVLDREIVMRSLDQALTRFSRQHLRLYFATAGMACRATWIDVLWSILNEGLLNDTGQEVIAQVDPTIGTTEIPSGGFDPLDIVLIKASVQSIANEHGALSVIQLEAAIQDLLGANSSRHHSYFHAGFIDGLMERQFDCSGPELNAERRCWKIGGYASALARRARQSDIIHLIDDRTDDLMRMLSEHPRFIHAVGIILYDSLRQSGRYSTIAHLFNGRSLLNGGVLFIKRALVLVGQLYRERKTAEVRLLLEPIEAAASNMGNRLGKEDRHEIVRRRAQVLKAEACFDEARTMFENLLPESDSRHRSMVRCDLGLAKGRFKWLSEVQIPRDKSAIAELKSRIEIGLDDFFASSSESSPGDANGSFVVGVYEMLQNHYSQAETTFRLAYERAMHREQVYQSTGVLPRLKLYYACSIFLSLDDPQFTNACDLIDSAAVAFPPAEWPEWLLEECLSSMIDLLPASSERLLSVIERHTPMVLRSYLCSHLDSLPKDLWTASERVRGDVHGLAFTDGSTSLELRFKAVKRIIELESEHMQTARWDKDGHERALESLVDLAGERQDALQATSEVMANRQHWNSIWEHREYLLRQAEVAVLRRSNEEAMELLFQSFQAHRSDGLPEEARAIRVRMEEIDASHRHVESARTILPDPEMTAWPRRKTKLRILFVGGNETQEQYHKSIRETLSEESAPLDIDFEPTGWGSNWNKDLERITPRLPNYDGVVIMRFVRTGFGRGLRAAICLFESKNDRKLPWHACTGHGEKSLYLSIVVCARKALAQSAT